MCADFAGENDGVVLTYKLDGLDNKWYLPLPVNYMHIPVDNNPVLKPIFSNILLIVCSRQSIDVIHMLEGRAYSISLPLRLMSINMLSRYDWLLTDIEQKRYLLQSSADDPMSFGLHAVNASLTGESHIAISF